eukprot:scaffold113604_cov17-Prasinocladus_malaysianus.AAC.1
MLSGLVCLARSCLIWCVVGWVGLGWVGPVRSGFGGFAWFGLVGLSFYCPPCALLMVDEKGMLLALGLLARTQQVSVIQSTRPFHLDRLAMSDTIRCKSPLSSCKYLGFEIMRGNASCNLRSIQRDWKLGLSLRMTLCDLQIKYLSTSDPETTVKHVGVTI